MSDKMHVARKVRPLNENLLRIMSAVQIKRETQRDLIESKVVTNSLRLLFFFY